MIGETVDIIGTAFLFLAPFVLALIVIVLVVAYPWLLLIPLGIWYLVVKYGSDETPNRRLDSTQTDNVPAAGQPPSMPTSASANGNEATQS